MDIDVNIDDKATTSYIRRTLCAHHIITASPPLSIHDHLPPLTSSNATGLQLYAIIGIVIKEFVQTWYNKITPDHEFTDEILRIIAHCMRALEERLRNVELEALFVDEVPHLIMGHISAFRISHQSGYTKPLATEPRDIFHTLRPHPALSPIACSSDHETHAKQERNEHTWRHMLVQSVLAVLLPSEDLQNASLRVLIEEVLAEIVLNNAITKRMSEPHILWELITNIIVTAQKPNMAGNIGVENPKSRNSSSSTSIINQAATRNQLAQYGLLSTTIKPPGQDALASASTIDLAFKLPLSNLIWNAIHYGFLLITIGRNLLLSLRVASSLPLRSRNTLDNWDSKHLTPRPIVSMGAWSMAAKIIDLENNMAWLSGIACLLRTTAVDGPGQIAKADSLLDRSLAQFIRKRVLNIDYIPIVLHSIRRTLFPANTFPRSSVQRLTTDAAQKAQIKTQCAAAILNSLPTLFCTTYLSAPGVDEQRSMIEIWLDLLGDSHMNKHLIFSLLELILVRLIPEIGEYGTNTLLDERLGIASR